MTPHTPPPSAHLSPPELTASPPVTPPRIARADVMVLGAVLGLISCLVCLVWFREGMEGEAVGIISMVAGIFGTCLRDAFQYEFGSSRGSKAKDEVIGTLAARNDGGNAP